MEFIGVAVIGAKNEALFPGRLPHVRLSVHGPKKTERSPFQRFCYVAIEGCQSNVFLVSWAAERYPKPNWEGNSAAGA